MIVTPERWYQAFWIGMGAVSLVCLYWVIRWAVAAGIRDAGR